MGDSVISARPNRLITLGTQNAAPPTDAYISQDDQLFVRIVNSAPGIAVFITVRLLLPDGRIQLNQFTYNPTSTRSSQQFSQFLAEGFLLSVTATGGANNVGQTYLNVTLVRNLGFGTFPASGAYGEILLQGYVTGGNALTWPRGTIGGTQSLQGNTRSITGTTPAVGAEISETVPANVAWQLNTFKFTLTSSAGGTTRSPFLAIDDGTNVLFEGTPNLIVNASTFGTYTWAQGTQATLTGAIAALALPIGIILQPGYRIRTLTGGLQVGDQYTAPQYCVEEWLQL